MVACQFPRDEGVDSVVGAAAGTGCAGASIAQLQACRIPAIVVMEIISDQDPGKRMGRFRKDYEG